MSMKYRLVTIADIVALTDLSKPLMFDTETVGLYGKIRLAQFFQRGWDLPLMVESPNTFELVSLLSKALVVCHNVHYDITTVQENVGRLSWMPEEFHCTFLLSRLHFYKQEGFSFDKVVSYVLGHNPYQNKKDMQASDWGAPVLSDEQLEYAASDVVYLHDVWDAVEARREDINYKLDLLTTRYCLDFQNNGMPVDVEKLQKRFRENTTRIKEIALPINCNSYIQVRKYISSNMSDDHGLSLLSIQGNERAKAVREARKLTKNNSFLKKFMDTMVDGCIFGKFKCSPRSGRTASDDQNLQQIPRSLKSIFGVIEGGDEVILFSDFAQVQLRAVCVVAGDTTMEKLFRSGADLHAYVAKMLFGDSFTKEQRQISKTANFGLLFGAGVATFVAILVKQADMFLTDDLAMAVKKKWNGLWKQITEWQNSGIKSWKKGEAWETPLGRRYTAKMMTDQLAMQIQGFEAEVAKLAMHYMLPKIKALHPSIKLRNFVHDCYLFTCVNDPLVYRAACSIIAEAMQEAWREMCQSVKITDLPMPTKVRVGWNWGDIEKDIFIHELSI